MKRTATAVALALAGLALTACGSAQPAAEPSGAVAASQGAPVASAPVSEAVVTSEPVETVSVGQWVSDLRETKPSDSEFSPTWTQSVANLHDYADWFTQCEPGSTCYESAPIMAAAAAKSLYLTLGNAPAAPAELTDLFDRTRAAAANVHAAATSETVAVLDAMLREWDQYS